MNRERVAELFDLAVEIPAGERAAWLAAACEGDAGLRTEVERLLRADAHTGEFLESPPEIVASAIDAATAADTALPHFGPWRTLRRIGSGGMGEVWLAERSDGEFEQRVAIKQLAYPTPGLLQRFRQERQILARLHHPDIARLIDGGVDDNGAPYLVMEYVDGMPITNYAREHALDLRARLALFQRVCAAVQYAHQNLVVHRDLKPSNIFVGADGAPKLLDFGIAKVLATTDEAAQTQTAARLLTPDYAAPEQFSGGTVTTATDVYALGVLLYELLTGTRPVRSIPADKVGDPVPPSSAGDRTWRRALRGDLDRIALTALAADPTRRYSSVEGLSGDVQRYLDGLPIAARRDSTWYRLRKFAARNRYAVAAALFVFAISIAAAAISMHQAQLARSEAQRANAVREFLSGVFDQANPDENKGQPITAHQLLEKGEQQLERESGAHPAIEGDLAALLAKLYRDVGDNERAWHLLQSALADNDKTGVPDDVRARVLLGVAAAETEDRDAYDSALAHARQALSLLDAATDRNWEEIASAHRIIALCLIRRGEDEAAVALLSKSIPVHRAELGAQSEALADEYVRYGVALGGLGRFDDAEIAFDQGSAMLRALYGGDSNRFAYSLNEKASMLYNKGDLDGAEALNRDVLKIHMDTLGPDHHNTMTALHNLLGVIERHGHYAEALPQRLALLERVKVSNQVSPVEKAGQFDAVGIDYRELGRFEESEAFGRQALVMIVESQGPRSPRSIVVMRHLGLTLAFLDRYAEAEALFRDALSIALERSTQVSLLACGLRRDIGQVLRQQHRAAEAVAELLALTKDACMVGLAESDPWRPSALADLSLAQLDDGKSVDAYATAQQAVAYGRKALRGTHSLGLPLFANGRAALATQHADEAETLLREALAVRSPTYVASDPRVLEVKVSLVKALAAQRKTEQAQALTAEIAPMLAKATSRYAAELRDQLVE